MADHHHHHHRYVLLFLVLFSSLTNSSYGYQFVVGGKDGWVPNPSENYSQWTQRLRFQVNDTLLFKYKSGSDSVLVVNKDDYDSCNTANPIQKLDDGNSIFKFDHSGPYYFISGNKTNCDNGQKLVVVVLAVRNRPVTPPTAPSPPSGGAPTPSASHSSPSPATGAPSVPPGSHLSPSPATGSPSPGGTHLSPSPSPSGSPLSPYPATGAPSPAGSPLSPYPAAGSPGPGAHGEGPSPAAEGPVPDIGSSGPSPGTSSPTTPGSPNASAPGGGTPADANSRGRSPGRSFAAPPCTPSILFVSLILSVGFGGFIVSH